MISWFDLVVMNTVSVKFKYCDSLPFILVLSYDYQFENRLSCQRSYRDKRNTEEKWKSRIENANDVVGRVYRSGVAGTRRSDVVGHNARNEGHQDTLLQEAR